MVGAVGTWLVYRLVRQMPSMAPARIATLYAIGIMAAYWSCTRIVAMLA